MTCDCVTHVLAFLEELVNALLRLLDIRVAIHVSGTLADRGQFDRLDFVAQAGKTSLHIIVDGSLGERGRNEDDGRLVVGALRVGCRAC